MIAFAAIGVKAVYLLFIWLLSAAGAAWLAERKGYGERLGLTFGLILTFVGFIIVLLLPGRPGSAWRIDGPLPRRRAGQPPAAAAEGPPAVAPAGPAAAPAGPASTPDDEPSPPRS